MPTFLIGKITVQIEQGDITLKSVDVIVNAANSQLQHGGGVAAAIISRGGSIIQHESDEWVRQHGLVTHSHPAITGAGNLPCQYIIHAVGPVWGEGDETIKLMQTISSSLQVANDLKCSSVAFPAISTGIFGFPMKLVAKCFREVTNVFANSDSLLFIQVVHIILFDQKSLLIFLDEFNQ